LPFNIHHFLCSDTDSLGKMKIPFKSILIAALAVDVVAASTWFSKAAYNKWHETELERWLSDHDVPYPTPADRRDLEKLVSSNWESKVQKPLSDTSDSATNAYGSVKDWVFARYSHFSAIWYTHPPRLTRNTQLDRLAAQVFP